MRSFSRALRVICFFCICSTAAVRASELNDGMQLFFEGQVEQSQQLLSGLIRQGHNDARIFYFRGLANHRLGQNEAAASDFQRAARLELSHSSHGVGQSLQRVQGAERLLLEKHRTMARLVYRSRGQQVAPKPSVRTNLPSAQLAASQPPPLMAPQSAPRFRLASEIPIRDQIGDPFKTRADSMLSNERKPQGPRTVPSSERDKPVGTGVVQASGTSDDESDPFTDDAFDVAPAKRSSDGESGVFGAVFRALRKATVPQVDPSGLIPGGMPTGNVLPSGEGADDTDDPFGGSDAGDDSAFDDFGDEDPFAE